MSQQDFDQLLQKYLLGKCSAQEEMLVLEWYKHLITESKLDISQSEKEEIQTKIWNNLSGQIQPEKLIVSESARVVPVRTLFYRRAISVAAAIILAFAGWYWWSATNASNTASLSNSEVPAGDVVFTNKTAIAQSITLPDKSIVTLEPSATLHYPKDFSDTLREVYLTGNAFFKIFRDTSKHFLVHSSGLVTEVLGTSFHISQNVSEGKVEIAVVTGKVSVYQKQTRLHLKEQPGSVILTPNQKVIYNSSNSQFVTSLVDEPKLVNADEEMNTKGSFIFDDVLLIEVVEALKNAYGIEIVLENDQLNKCHFTGDITRQDLYKKLEIICQSFPSASYEVKGTTIIVKGKGCN